MVNKERNVWIIAGETSGDKYGAKLAEALNNNTEERVNVSGMGGIEMKKAGINILADSTELGVVGLIEVLQNIFTFIKIFKKLTDTAAKERPDAVVLIDFPGFNLLFAKKLYKLGIPVVWYVSPQVWTWKKNRVKKLAKYCKKILVIFPFEIDIYKDYMPVTFVGHPLVDIIKEESSPEIKSDPNKFLILPGSRSHEIKRLLPILLESSHKLFKRNPSLKFKVSCARDSLKPIIEDIINKFQKKHSKKELPKFEVVSSQNIKLLQECGTGFAKSGTTTLECAIVGLPVVTFYKLNPLTFLIARIIIRRLFRNSFIMPNIVANKTIYKEFLQGEVTPNNLAEAAEEILPGGSNRERVIRDMKELTNNKLTYGKTDASTNAAQAIKELFD